MKTRPVLTAAAAGEADDVLDRRIVPARSPRTAVSFSRMAGNEMSCAPAIEPIRRPVSCCGKNPLGTDDVQVDVQRDGRRA